MFDSRPNTMTKIAFLVSGLAYAFSAALADYAMQKTVTTDGVNLNETLLRASSDSCSMPCRFRLCEYDELEENVLRRRNGAMLLLPQRRMIASYPWICHEDDSIKMGSVVGSEEAKVKADDGSYVKISLFTPATLYNRFARKFVLPVQLNAPSKPHRSGLGIKKTMTRDQKESLEERCLMIRIKKYEVLGPSGTVESIRRARGADNCLSFTVSSQFPLMTVELYWTNQDDMDLSVREPNGNEISHRNTVSSTGGEHKGDVTTGHCGLKNQEREVEERIEWGASSSPLRGDYEVTVKHYESCGNGGLQWFLFVDINGTNFFFETGVHDLSVDGSLASKIEIDTFIVTITS